MNALKALGRLDLVLAAAMIFSGFQWHAADAAVVHGASVETIEHSYGRAGGLAGSEEVTGTGQSSGADPMVTITYSPDVAQWTNMPRDQAHEGPVTDGLGTASAPQPDVLEHWYGRAGGAIGVENTKTDHASPSLGSQTESR
jgi:hypothetical protein